MYDSANIDFFKFYVESRVKNIILLIYLFADK